jgi:hypothetical protein
MTFLLLTIKNRLHINLGSMNTFKVKRRKSTFYICQAERSRSHLKITAIKAPFDCAQGDKIFKY